MLFLAIEAGRGYYLDAWFVFKVEVFKVSLRSKLRFFNMISLLANYSLNN